MTDIARPLPRPDDLTRFFWEGTHRRELLILRCDSCGNYVHLPEPICPRCLSFDLTPAKVSGRGTVYTFTVAAQAFHPFFQDRLPYVLVVAELPEQPELRFMSALVECTEDDVAVGMEVEVVFEDVAPAVTLPLLRPRAVGGASSRLRR